MRLPAVLITTLAMLASYSGEAAGSSAPPSPTSTTAPSPRPSTKSPDPSPTASPGASPTASPSPSPSPTPMPHLLVEGQVFDYIGSGIAGVQVTLRDPAGALLGEAVTNAIGDFQVRAERPVRGPAKLALAKEHYAGQEVEVKLGGEDGPPFVDCEMSGALVLEGVVKDSVEDRPVAGAVVLVEMAYRSWPGQSDAAGRFRIEGLPPGRARLRAEAEGFARHVDLIEAIEAAGAQTIVMRPERIVQLEVASDTGKPLAEVNVECLDDFQRDYRHLVTDENGKTTIRGLPFEARALELRLSAEGYVADLDFARRIELPADVRESTHKLTMQAAARLVGKVLDAASKKPLPGARLVVGSVLDERQPRAWTDYEGAFELTNVPPGEAVVTVHLAEYAPQLDVVRLAPGQEATLELLLTPARVVRGVVTGPQGEKLANVYIHATRWRGHESLGLRALTNAEGRFEMADAPADAFEVAVYLAGFKPLTDQTIPSGDAEVAFALEEGPAAPKQGPAFEVGEKAPEFTLTTLGGEKLTLGGLAGKVVLLDFWATWCGPCIEEIPNLVAVHEQFKGHADFVMISASLDDGAATVQRFIERRSMPWRHAAGPASGIREAATAYRVVGIPALFVIGRDGRFTAIDLRGGAIAPAVAAALGVESGE